MRNAASATVVLIDNDESVNDAIQTCFERDGYPRLTTASGSRALSLFEDGGVNLIITDINMPAGDRIARARAFRRTSRIPVIFITGFHDALRNQLRGLPNVAVLGKPFRSQVLVELVETQLAPSAASETADFDATDHFDLDSDEAAPELPPPNSPPTPPASAPRHRLISPPAPSSNPHHPHPENI